MGVDLDFVRMEMEVLRGRATCITQYVSKSAKTGETDYGTFVNSFLFF